MVLYKKELSDFYRLPDTSIFSVVKSLRLNLWLRKGMHYWVFMIAVNLAKKNNICHRKVTEEYSANSEISEKIKRKILHLPYHY
jgi:hypothetical protein